MIDPRILFAERNLSRRPLGHGCHVIPLAGGKFRVVGNSDESIGKECVDGEFSGNLEFVVNRGNSRIVVVAAKLLETGEVLAEDGFRYIETDWTGYLMDQLDIYLDNDFADPPLGLYDNHEQWSVYSAGMVVREPTWPVVQRVGTFGDGRFDAPSYDPAASIQIFEGGVYAVPIDPADIESEMLAWGDFVQLTATTGANALYYGSATTNITSGADHGVWMYKMTPVEGKLYTQVL
jgi:hypothetical protein